MKLSACAGFALLALVACDHPQPAEPTPPPEPPAAEGTPAPTHVLVDRLLKGTCGPS